jgi:hypothetical protein
MIEAWERAKLHITLDQSDPVAISVPLAVDRCLPRLRKRLEAAQDGVANWIQFLPGEVRTLFDTAVAPILDILDEQLRDMQESARSIHAATS